MKIEIEIQKKREMGKILSRLELKAEKKVQTSSFYQFVK